MKQKKRILMILAILGLCVTLCLAQDTKKKRDSIDVTEMSREERISRHMKFVEEMRAKRREREKQEQKGKLKDKKASERTGIQREGPGRISDMGGAAVALMPTTRSSLSTILHFTPVDQTVYVGDQFYTPLIIESGYDILFDRISIVMSYAPRFLKPVKVFDNHLRSLLGADPVFTIDSDDGIITYKGKLKHPATIDDKYLLNFLWEAQHETTSTKLDFLFDAPESTLLALGNKDRLGEPRVSNDGTIRSSILIKPIETKATFSIITNKRDFFILEGIDEKNMGGITLSLVSNRAAVDVDEEFVVEVIVDNPRQTNADNVSLWVKYDPERLQALDWDTGNWISRGENINDGEVRETYPFDLLIKNRMNNVRGEIEYRMGFIMPQILESGTLAKIKFKALEPILTTSIHFDFTSYPKYPNTIITYQGIDVLGSPFHKADGTARTTVMIRRGRGLEQDKVLNRRSPLRTSRR